MSVVSNLLSLPELGFTFTVENNADWIEGIGYTDPTSGAPIPLDGILLQLTVRRAVGNPSVLFFASTANGLLVILPATAGSSVNSVWAVALFEAQFPTFLPPGTFVFELQGLVGGYTRNLAAGPIIVTEGVS